MKTLKLLMLALLIGCEGEVAGPAEGTLSVSSDPIGALVVLNGEETGKVTPAEWKEIDPGSYEVILKKDGYKDTTFAAVVKAGRVVKIDVTLKSLCEVTGIIGDLDQLPIVDITYMSYRAYRMEGTVINVDRNRHRIVLWVKTDWWYVQPFINDPFTEIECPGVWSNTTHGGDVAIVLVVDETYDPNENPGGIRFNHPAYQQGVVAWTEEAAPSSNGRFIYWSDLKWDTKFYGPRGPGNNYWSNTDESMWVDGEDRLHMKIREDAGTWYCSEIQLNRSLGYGAYEWRIDSDISSFDRNIVFAPFIYASETAELDIEFGTLDKEPPLNAQYIIQPYDVLGNRHDFLMGEIGPTTHRIDWQSDRVVFTSWRGHGSYPPSPLDLLETWEYGGGNNFIPGLEDVHVNLWLWFGQPPTDGQEVEVILKNFTFTP